MCSKGISSTRRRLNRKCDMGWAVMSVCENPREVDAGSDMSAEESCLHARTHQKSVPTIPTCVNRPSKWGPQ
jgi:hypothetical protein